ncbi:MAG: efflux RND transporter periplasmic adaptor subunit [Desulfobulbaceae bacterium]|nr:efflux RND transporter periplasmic adaptor subunit [Desulfobulbaceae bacterium]
MKNKIFFIVIAILVAGAALWYWRQNNAANQVNYLTETAARGTVTRQVVATGKMDAVDLVSVGAQVSGQIEKVHVRLGQQVKKGELVAEIDSISQLNQYNTDKAALASHQAQLVAKQAALRIAQTRYDRENALRKRDATSKDAYEDAVNGLALAKAEVAQVQSQIRQTELALDTDELRLGYTKITAPLDGTVVAVVVDEGQTVNANQTTPTIVQIADLGKMENNIEISEGDIGVIKEGMPVEFTVLSMPDIIFKSSISSLDPGMTTLSDGKYGSSSASSSSAGASGAGSDAVYFYGKARMDNPDGLLRIGMTTENIITVDEVRDTLVVAITAVQNGPGGKKSVQVLNAAGEPEEREIRTGLSDGIHVQIVSGLEEGEAVIMGQLTQAEINRGGSGMGGRRMSGGPRR